MSVKHRSLAGNNVNFCFSIILLPQDTPSAVAAFLGELADVIHRMIGLEKDHLARHYLKHSIKLYQTLRFYFRLILGATLTATVVRTAVLEVKNVFESRTV